MATNEALIQRATENIKSVIEAPDTKLDASLFERVRRETLPSTISDTERSSLVCLIIKLLQNIQQDPTPATQLAEALVEPYSFSTILDLEVPVDLVAGLKAPSPPIQLLVLRLLGLAAKNIGDVGIVAANPDLIATLVDLWLRTSSIAVAESARQVVNSLCLAEANSQSSPSSSGAVPPDNSQQGLMSRRLFKDKNVYDLLFSLPSLRTVGKPGQLAKRDKTLSQGRLFDLLKEIWPLTEIWQSQMPDVEQLYGLKSGQGLLHFATLHMIDKTDVLLRVTQIDFFTNLIKAVTSAKNSQMTSAQLLDFLTSTGTHEEIISIYSSPETQDPIDITFHYAPAARYVAAFAHGYHEYFLSDTATRTKIFKRLHEVLDGIPSSQWARNDGPSHDLHVLVSLPRLALIPDPILIFRLPTRPASADVFRTLAQIFSGRLAEGDDADAALDPNVITLPTPAAKKATPWLQIEQWAALQLFLQYLNRYPSFWLDVIRASSVTAFRDTSVAAISLLHTIVQARWRTEPGSNRFGIDLSALDTESEDGWYGSEPPSNGVAAVIHPQVLDILLPFVMKGPEGRGVSLLGADTESAAYHIHQAKLRLTGALEAGIRDSAEKLVDGSEEKAMLSDLAVGLAGLRRQGFDRRDEAGAEVGTMEL